MWCILNFPGYAIFGDKPFSGEKPFSKKNLLPLPCKECSKSFSESGSLKTHLTLIQEKSHLLVKNVPNNFLRRSHSPVHCSLFHKRKSVSLLHHFWLCPLLSSNMLLSMFWAWVLRTSLTTILHRIYDKVKDSQPCQHYHDYFQWLLFIDIIKDTLDKFEKLWMKYKVIFLQSLSLNISAK